MYILLRKELVLDVSVVIKSKKIIRKRIFINEVGTEIYIDTKVIAKQTLPFHGT